jgi:TolB-like protein
MPLLQAPSALATQIVLGYRGRTPIRVAVMRISVEEAEWKGMGDVLSEGLITQLFAKGNFNLVERAQVDQADKEIGQSKGAKFDSATVKRLGRAVSADAIIVGTLFRSGPGPIVNCRMLDVETGEILATAGPLLIRAESDSESQPGVSRSGTKKDTRTGAGGSMEAIGDGLRIRIVECTASGGSLAVVLSITSEGKDRQAVFASSSYFSLPQSRVILADGSQFRSTGVETGDGHTVSLVDGIPARAVLHFKGIPQSDSLPLLEVFIQVENVNATSYRFKSVPVSR